MTKTATRSPLLELLRRRSDAARLYDQLRDVAGRETTAALHRLAVQEADDEIRALYGDRLDIAFRSALVSGGAPVELPFETRALGATAHGQIADKGFTAAYLDKAVESAPLLDVGTVVTTSHGGDWQYGFITTGVTVNGVVADGVTITDTDPVFDGAVFKEFGFKGLCKVSQEMVRDSSVDLERLAAEHFAPLQARALSTQLWEGDGTTEPQGLMAGISNTVNAAGAAVCTFDDVAAVLNGVPAADRYSGDCTILLSPGAHIDLLEEQPLHPGWMNGTIHGFPFRVDPALPDPATTVKGSVVAGNFRQAYAVRLAGLRIDSTGHGAGFATDQIHLRVVLRADGRRMRTGGLRALLHP
jgi:HK97 family phage major capsid protein